MGRVTTDRSATPFLKWAGGKAQLVDQLRPLFPSSAGRYYEPFLGSGAVFFAFGHSLCEEPPRLSDSNPHLINSFSVVRDDPGGLLELLRRHSENHGKDYYYETRAVGLEAGTCAERAARFIYLNRTCFNGLFRLNRKGQFNVPIGRYTNPRIWNPDLIQSVSGALQGVELSCKGFDVAVAGAESGDFVYFDPPYDPLSSTASFTSYTKDSFGRTEQGLLADCVADLTRRGVKVALSNSATPFIRDLYSEKYRMVTVSARRRINSRAEGRGPTDEVVVLNY